MCLSQYLYKVPAINTARRAYVTYERQAVAKSAKASGPGGCQPPRPLNAYSAVVYVRSVDLSGEVYFQLLCSKTKVAPVKTLTIPRLELCEAMIYERFSSLIKLKRVFAYVLRFIRNSRNKEQKETGQLTVIELENSMICLSKLAQNDCYLDEITIIKSKKELNKKSRLGSLNPFIDSNGLLRVEGRFKKLSLSFDTKHPILLDEHIRLLHPGPQLSLFSVRQSFWVTSGMNLAEFIVRNCVRCFRFKPKPANTIMARRGTPSHLYSDNATNFVASQKELIKFYNFLQNSENELIALCSKENIIWHFIPPNSPNFGGLWESNIKAIKNHLYKVIGDSVLTNEEYLTQYTISSIQSVQIEAVLNLRPLHPMSSDPNDLTPLTPNHLLIGKLLITPPDPLLND
ncbi:hypothetical protein HUJ04_010505, partial [Dendroctonus ponderosae]